MRYTIVTGRALTYIRSFPFLTVLLSLLLTVAVGVSRTRHWRGSHGGRPFAHRMYGHRFRMGNRFRRFQYYDVMIEPLKCTFYVTVSMSPADYGPISNDPDEHERAAKFCLRFNNDPSDVEYEPVTAVQNANLWFVAPKKAQFDCSLKPTSIFLILPRSWSNAELKMGMYFGDHYSWTATDQNVPTLDCSAVVYGEHESPDEEKERKAEEGKINVKGERTVSADDMLADKMAVKCRIKLDDPDTVKAYETCVLPPRSKDIGDPAKFAEACSPGVPKIFQDRFKSGDYECTAPCFTKQNVKYNCSGSQWTGSCSSVECSRYMPHDNDDEGLIRSPDDDYLVVDKSVTLRCMAGWYLADAKDNPIGKPSVKLRCEKNTGWKRRDLSCEKACNANFSANLEFEEMVVVDTKPECTGMVTQGVECQVGCTQGYVVFGQSVLTCGSNGKWEGDAKCSHAEHYCNTKKVSVGVKYKESSEYGHQILRYSCPKKLEYPSPKSQSVCVGTDLWDPGLSLIECEEGCDFTDVYPGWDIKAITQTGFCLSTLSGNVACNGVKYKFECPLHKQFIDSEPKKLPCANGDWQHDLGALCEVTDGLCDDYPNSDGTSMIVVPRRAPQGGFKAGAVVSLECAADHFLEPNVNSAFCENDGTWSETVVCEAILCAPFHRSAGLLLQPDVLASKPNVELELSCDDPAQYLDPDIHTVKCIENVDKRGAKWDHPNVTCEMSCNVQSLSDLNIEFSTAHCASKTIIKQNDECAVQCFENSQFNFKFEPPIMKCGPSGKWQPDKIECVRFAPKCKEIKLSNPSKMKALPIPKPTGIEDVQIICTETQYYPSEDRSVCRKSGKSGNAWDPPGSSIHCELGCFFEVVEKARRMKVSRKPAAFVHNTRAGVLAEDQADFEFTCDSPLSWNGKGDQRVMCADGKWTGKAKCVKAGTSVYHFLDFMDEHKIPFIFAGCALFVLILVVVLISFLYSPAGDESDHELSFATPSSSEFEHESDQSGSSLASFDFFGKDPVDMALSKYDAPAGGPPPMPRQQTSFRSLPLGDKGRKRASSRLSTHSVPVSQRPHGPRTSQARHSSRMSQGHHSSRMSQGHHSSRMSQGHHSSRMSQGRHSSRISQGGHSSRMSQHMSRRSSRTSQGRHSSRMSQHMSRRS
eukprot:180247_1